MTDFLWDFSELLSFPSTMDRSPRENDMIIQKFMKICIHWRSFGALANVSIDIANYILHFTETGFGSTNTMTNSDETFLSQ